MWTFPTNGSSFKKIIRGMNVQAQNHPTRQDRARPNQTITQEDTKRLRTILENNSVIERILRRTPRLQMPNWYLGAGCIAQTVWNSLHGFEPTRNIQDYDLAYFDSTDLSEETEEGTIQKAQSALGDLGVTMDVKNEARVHIWYKNHSGNAILPYQSIKDSIPSSPPPATPLGLSDA